MLEFIKNLFKEKQAETIALEDIGPWFKERSESRLQDFDEFLGAIRLQITAQIKQVRESLKILETAELRNKNVPGKALNYLDGNRNSYIKRIEDFLSTIDIDNLKNVEPFLKDFKKNLTLLSKQSAKAYTILEEFLGEQTGKIADNIRKLNKSIEEVEKEYTAKNIHKLSDVKTAIIDLKELITLKKSLKRGLENTQKSLEEHKQKESEYERKVAELKASREYKELTTLQQQKKVLEKQIYELNSNFNHSFTVIEAAMKKFERIAYENTDDIKHYLDNPVATIKKDADLVILKIIKNLKDNIASGTVELKDSKKKRILEEAKKMDRQFFTSFIEKSKGFQGNLDILTKQITATDIQDTLQKTQTQLSAEQEKIQELESKIPELKEKIENIDIIKLKKELEGKIRNTLNTDVTIT